MSSNIRLRMDECWGKLSDALTANHGHDVKVEYDNLNRAYISEVDGLLVTSNIDLREDRTGDSWRSRPSGKLRFVVTNHYYFLGARADTKQFPEPKAGFDYDKIAAHLHGVVEELKRRVARLEEQEAQEQASQNQLQRVLGKLDPDKDWHAGVEFRVYLGQLRLIVKRDFNDEKWVKLLKFLEKNGYTR